MKILYKVSAVLTIASTLSLGGAIVALAASPAAVNLGTAGNFVILSKTGISTTGSSYVSGDIGVSPAAATYITGFGLMLPASGAYSTSNLISGKVYAPGYADPSASVLTTAVLDMQNAYSDGAGRASTATELGAGNIGGLTLAAGVYKWGTGVTIPSDVTLTGSASDVWIFVIGQGLDISSGVKVLLSGGAQPGNVYWIVAGQTTVGTGATIVGNILDQTAIVLNTGATLNGRALAQTAVTLNASSVTSPSGSSMVIPPPATVTPVATTYVPAQTSTYNPAPVYVQSTAQATVVPSCPTGFSCAPAMPAPVSIGCPVGFSCALAMPSVSAGCPAGYSCALAPGMNSNTSLSIRTVSANLGKGERGSDVQVLQQFLISQNKGPAARALGNAGATAFFGDLTLAALSEYQASAGVTPSIGNFGPKTRAYIMSHY